MNDGRRAADRRREREGAPAADASGEETTRSSLDEEGLERTVAPRARRQKAKASEETRVALNTAGEALTGLTPAPLRKPASANLRSREDDLGEAWDPSRDVEETQPGTPAPAPPVGGAFIDLEEEDPRAILIESSPCVIGRALGCGLHLQDPDVSRAHCMLTYVEEDQIWVLEEIRAKGGTVVNGVVLTKPCLLQAGDVLEIGKTVLRFEWAASAPLQLPENTATELSRLTQAGVVVAAEEIERRLRPKGKKRKKAPMVAAFLGLLLLGAAIGGGVWLATRKHENPAQIAAQVETLLEQARTLLKAGKFSQAQTRIEALFALKPGDLQAKSLERTLRSEIKARTAIKKAKKLQAAGKLDAMREVLRQVADSSMFADARDQLLLALKDLSRRRELEAIEALLQSGDLDQAFARLARYQKSNPDDRVAGRLLKRAAAAKNYRPPENAAVVRAKAAFAVGNVAQARIIVRQEAGKGVADAARYLAKLNRFKALRKKGVASLKAKQGLKSKTALAAAYDLAAALGGGKNSSLRREVGASLADALYLASLGDQAAGRTCVAAKDRLRAYALDPDDAKLRAAKRKLDRQAKAALSRAKAKAATAPAKAKAIAEKAKCLASPQSKVGKALRKLAAG